AGGSGGQALRLWAGQEPSAPDRLFLPHRKMEPAWSAIAFAVDVSEMYDVERQALAAYGSIFKPTGDQLSMLYEVEDACWGLRLRDLSGRRARSCSTTRRSL